MHGFGPAPGQVCVELLAAHGIGMPDNSDQRPRNCGICQRDSKLIQQQCAVIGQNIAVVFKSYAQIDGRQCGAGFAFLDTNAPPALVPQKRISRARALDAPPIQSVGQQGGNDVIGRRRTLLGKGRCRGQAHGEDKRHA